MENILEILSVLLASISKGNHFAKRTLLFAGAMNTTNFG